MKSILSKTKKYPQSKSTNSIITTKEKKVLSPPEDTTGATGNRIDIHEISTQSIIQTSALLHLWNDMNTTPATTSVVVTPTHNESVITNGNETAAASNTTNTLVVVPPFRSFRHHDEMNNNDDNDNDDDSDTVESNGASISDEDDNDDSQNAVVVDTVRSRNTDTTAADLEVTNLLSRRNGTSSLNTPNKLCSNIELNDMVISEECSVRVASPLGEPKEVRFMDELDDDYHHNQQEKESFILHEQLRNMLQDLSHEKAQRFRKEKALIKLAKQLKKRNQTIQEYEVKLIQMAKFINTLQLELQSHRALQQEPQEQQQQQRELESHRDKQVQEEANDDDRANDQEEDKEELVSSPTKTEEKTLLDESSISLLHDTIQALRAELQESQRQIQVLQNQERDRSVPPKTGNGTELKELIVVPTNKLEPSHKTTVTYRIHPFMVMLYLYGIVVVMGTVWYVTGMTIPTTNVMIQNVLCAPIRPGTTLLPHKSNGSTMIYEAPWWIPTITTTYTGTKSNFKSMVHNTFCSNVPRTSMHWTGDKLMIYDVTTAVGIDDHWTGSTTSNTGSHHSNKKILLLQGRGPAGVQFHWYDSSPTNSGYHESQNNNNIIQLLRTHRAGIALPAPWIGSPV